MSSAGKIVKLSETNTENESDKQSLNSAQMASLGDLRAKNWLQMLQINSKSFKHFKILL